VCAFSTTGGVPKLADFGSSFVAHRFNKPTLLNGFSRAFAAPEVLQFLPVDLPTAVDVYSFGIVVLHVARVETAGGADNSLTSFDNTAAWTPVTVPPDLPRPLQAVVRECLAAKPEQRCTFRSLVATLEELDKKLPHG
jgi:serine/threonine protein kinase